MDLHTYLQEHGKVQERKKSAHTVKPVLSDHSKKDKDLRADGSFLQVESVAECSLGAFSNTFDLH